MKFTEEEKICMLKAMDALIKVDEDIDEKEVEFLEVMVDEFDWDTRFLDKLEQYREEDALHVIRNLSTDKLAYFQTLLCELANSDRIINQKEIEFINGINEYIMANKV